MTNAYTPTLTADWDIQLDSSGNLAMSKGAQAIAQNISCACKNFKGGLWFFADHGIDWFSDALEQKFRKSLIASRIRQTAQSIEGVETVDAVNIDDLNTETRTVTGEVLFTTTEGENGRAVIH